MNGAATSIGESENNMSEVDADESNENGSIHDTSDDDSSTSTSSSSDDDDDDVDPLKHTAPSTKSSAAGPQSDLDFLKSKTVNVQDLAVDNKSTSSDTSSSSSSSSSTSVETSDSDDESVDMKGDQTSAVQKEPFSDDGMVDSMNGDADEKAEDSHCDDGRMICC